MPDDSLDILVRTRADVSGAQKAEDSLKGVKKAAQETKAGLLDGLNPALANYGLQAEQAATKTTKAASAKRQLKDAARGLASQFPILGQMASLALNPITAAVAAVAGAFLLWRKRVDDLTTTLAGVELPDLTQEKVDRVNEAAEAWKKFGESLSAVAEAYNSVEAASDRMLKKLNSEHDQKQKLMESEKKVALARLEADKGNMSEPEYAKRKLGIEEAYAAAGVKEDQKNKQQNLAEQGRKMGNLVISAQKKLAEAGGIRIGSAEQDAAMEADLKNRADAAEAENKIRRAWLGTQADMKGSALSALSHGPQYYFRYGPKSFAEAQQTEEEAIAINQVNIDRYNEFLARKSSRKQARSRRDSLIAGGSADAAAAFGIEQGLPDAQAALQADNAAGNAMLRNDSLGRAYGAAGEAATNVQRVQGEIAKAIEKGNGVSLSTINLLNAWLQQMTEMQQRIRQLESRGSAGVRGAQ
jgi:hypothetical protein